MTRVPYYTSREVAAAAGVPYATLMRWLKTGVLLRRGPAHGGGLLWNERDLEEARIAAGVRDYISRAEGPFVEVMRAAQALAELPRDPALHLDALGQPRIVEYDPEDSDHLRLFAAPEVRRQWARRRSPRQQWVEQHEIAAMDAGQQSTNSRKPAGVLDLFE
jgi:DNA-binding transcriptional MerR regulator